MLEYLCKRLLLAALTLLVIMLVSYVLLRLAPGDPTRANFFQGESGNNGAIDSRGGQLLVNRSLRERLALDKPILTGFAIWLKRALGSGDFGESATVEPGRPVIGLIMSRLPVTLWLNAAAILLTYIISIPIGVLTGAHQDSFGDRFSEFSLYLLYSLPVMWVGLLLQALFCDGGRFPCFPITGLAAEDQLHLNIWEYQLSQLKHAFLPVVCLTYSGIAGLSRYARGSMLGIISSDFIRTARAKGLTKNAVIWCHAFRNALITMITLFNSILPGLIAGSMLVEYIFNIPGMGTLSLLALSSRDYPLIMALFAFSGSLTLAGILLSDLLYSWADPRIKL